ncbi:cell morphology protein, partial [Pseudomonas syringae pv. actinidiae ICMP 19070]
LGGASLSGENWRAMLLRGSADTQLLAYGSLQLDERRSLERFQQSDADWLVRQIARMQLSARDVVILDVPCGDLLMLEQALNAASQVLVVLTADAALARARAGRSAAAGLSLRHQSVRCIAHVQSRHARCHGKASWRAFAGHRAQG